MRERGEREGGKERERKEGKIGRTEGERGRGKEGKRGRMRQWKKLEYKHRALRKIPAEYISFVYSTN